MSNYFLGFDPANFINMENNANYLKLLQPFLGVIFCPVTILFFWSIWSGPVVESDTEIIEEIQL